MKAFLIFLVIFVIGIPVGGYLYAKVKSLDWSPVKNDTFNYWSGPYPRSGSVYKEKWLVAHLPEWLTRAHFSWFDIIVGGLLFMLMGLLNR